MRVILPVLLMTEHVHATALTTAGEKDLPSPISHYISDTAAHTTSSVANIGRNYYLYPLSTSEFPFSAAGSTWLGRRPWWGGWAPPCSQYWWRPRTPQPCQTSSYKIFFNFFICTLDSSFFLNERQEKVLKILGKLLLKKQLFLKIIK
jgi:hypothetical protein